MKLDDIFAHWEQDSIIDRTMLDTEALKIPKLHHKYFKIYTNERLVLRKLEAQLKQLKLEKYEFYTQGPTQEQHAKGWKLPPIGKILKADSNQYVEADNDIVNVSLKIGIQLEKIELLESIIKSLQNRGYNIKAAIDFLKFQQGM